EDEGDLEEFNEEVIDTKQFKAKLIRAERVSDEFQKGERIEVTFEVENKRKDTVTVRGEEVSVDGKMVDDMMVYMMQDVSGGKKADIVLTIDDNYGKEKLPEVEENLEFILKVYSKENIESLDEHVVKIDFKLVFFNLSCLLQHYHFLKLNVQSQSYWCFLLAYQHF